jgi:hypothetical protein
MSDEDKPAAAVPEQQAQSINGRVRRGLALSNEELMALVVEAYGVGGDPVIGSGQTAEEYAERIRDAFARKAPADACASNGTRCARDNRRWQG